MPATADDLTLARSWIGTWETDDAFNERFDRLNADLDAAVAESLRAHLSSLVSQASSITVEDISLSFSQNIIALEKLIETFRDVDLNDDGVVSDASVGVTRLARCQFR